MIILTGSIAYDFIVDFPGKFEDSILPTEIHKINLSFIVNNHKRRRGGTAANTYYTLSLLNTKSKLFAMVGKDISEFENDYEKIGFLLPDVVKDENELTSTGFAITDKANNQIWGYSYGAASKSSKLRLSKIAKKGDLVLIGPCGRDGTMGFTKQCIKLGLDYLFDPSLLLSGLTDEDIALGIQHAKYFLGNDYEMALMEKRLGKKWPSLLEGKIIITTLGAKGAKIKSKGKVYTIGIARPKEIVDPTGAGDAWRGGFLAGVQRGFDLQICGQMGAVASSFAIECYGTQEHKFTTEQFQERYRKNFADMLQL
ncbi:MAG TPA: PfkB family carbohydrate kinase [Patescibacteria group bacterium]